jgi:hypothetical protein
MFIFLVFYLIRFQKEVPIGGCGSLLLEAFLGFYVRCLQGRDDGLPVLQPDRQSIPQSEEPSDGSSGNNLAIL